MADIAFAILQAMSRKQGRRRCSHETGRRGVGLTRRRRVGLRRLRQVVLLRWQRRVDRRQRWPVMMWRGSRIGLMMMRRRVGRHGPGGLRRRTVQGGRDTTGWLRDNAVGRLHSSGLRRRRGELSR